LNLDPEGNRVDDPRKYGYFVKTRTMAGRARIFWNSQDMPLEMLQSVREQLASALADLDEHLENVAA
jgi:hypothetical protein